MIFKDCPPGARPVDNICERCPDGQIESLERGSCIDPADCSFRYKIDKFSCLPCSEDLALDSVRDPSCQNKCLLDTTGSRPSQTAAIFCNPHLFMIKNEKYFFNATDTTKTQRVKQEVGGRVACEPCGEGEFLPFNNEENPADIQQRCISTAELVDNNRYLELNVTLPDTGNYRLIFNSSCQNQLPPQYVNSTFSGCESCQRGYYPDPNADVDAEDRCLEIPTGSVYRNRLIDCFDTYKVANENQSRCESCPQRKMV